MPTDLIAAHELTKWEEASYAFLAEKQRRSGSIRTVESYARMLKHFFTNWKTPDQVTSQDVFGWADRINTPATVNDQNWTWRMPWPNERLAFEPGAAAAVKRLRDWCKRYHRS